MEFMAFPYWQLLRDTSPSGALRLISLQEPVEMSTVGS